MLTADTWLASSFGRASTTAASQLPFVGQRLVRNSAFSIRAASARTTRTTMRPSGLKNLCLHLLPHWNWAGKEGQPIRVWAHSNCDEVELLLNDQSLGRRKVERNSHAEWEVPYEPGKLVVRGFNDGEEVVQSRIETTGPPVAVRLTPHRSTLQADGQDVSVVTVEVVDAEGRHVPTANHEVTFEADRCWSHLWSRQRRSLFA